MSYSPVRMGRIIHTVAWCILFGMPFFFTGRQTESVTVESYTRFVVMPLSFMVVFYVNYFGLVKRYLLRQRTAEFFFSNLLLIALTMVVVHLLMQYLPDDPTRHRPPRQPDFQHIVGFFAGNA